MPRINQLPVASSVASTDVVAIDTQDKTYRVPKSTLFDGYYTAAEVDAAIAQSTAYVPTMTHGLTAGTGVSLDANQVSKLSIGKLRIYAFVFTTTSSISAESPLITGFDAARGSANGVYSCVLFNNNARTEQKFAFMHGQSYLCCTTAISANTTWRGNIVYMAS